MQSEADLALASAYKCNQMVCSMYDWITTGFCITAKTVIDLLEKRNTLVPKNKTTEAIWHPRTILQTIVSVYTIMISFIVFDLGLYKLLDFYKQNHV